MAALEACGWTVWWDRTIVAGKIWEREIEAALAAARCVIVAWSEAAVGSDWVWTEADEGKRRGVLVPVLLDEVTIPLAFRRIHAASLVGWDGRGSDGRFGEVVRAVSGLLGSSAPPPREEVSVNEPIVPKPAEKVSRIAVSTPKLSAKAGMRSLLLFGVLGVGCLIGLGWYFASRAHNSEPTTVAQTTNHAQAVAPAAGAIKVNPKDNLRYVWIPAGKFMMGCSPDDSECDGDEKPLHEVNISGGFWLGQTEVTQAAYAAVTGKPNPSRFKGDGSLPVEEVNWEEAKSYCEAVGMRLPTEAEWEYAARARDTGPRYGKLDEIAWYSGNSGGKTHPVGQRAANAWGLYDMLGNVWEWVNDRYDARYYERKVSNDPMGPKASPENRRVLRGGSWGNFPEVVRVSFRDGYVAGFRSGNFGFRCAGELR